MLNPFRGNKPVVVPTTILLTNPFGAILKITKVIINNTKIPGGDLMLGTANSNDLNFDIPRYASVWLPQIDLNVDLTQHEEMISAFIFKMEKDGSRMRRCWEILFFVWRLSLSSEGYVCTPSK